ncbi:MAG: 30S ribosomal protein S20 [Myxococcales bacterium]|nr:30S ribosomal protein S20 [Myxococcales bacterium]
MANNKSAIKRIRQNEKARLRNRLVMASMRTAVKKARAAVDSSADNAAELVRAASSRIDRAVSKGALKRTTASRYIARLAVRKSS